MIRLLVILFGTVFGHFSKGVFLTFHRCPTMVTDICITNWSKLVLQIGASLFYYKLGQTLLQIGAASLLQLGASAVTTGAAITN